jgi:asparagine synthase (glutamine-hydrolysing)
MRLFDDGDGAHGEAGHVSPGPLAASRHDRLLEMMSSDFLQYLPDDNLAKVDRAAMSTALEVRLPLLSHRVLEASWRLGRSFWVRDGRSKWVLRRLLDRYVPTTLFERPKMGFTVPVRDWLDGPLRAWSGDLLHSAALRDRLGVHSGLVERECQAMLRGAPGSARRVWALTILGAWAQADGPAQNGD